jgi:hypothetical protein
MRPGWVDVIAKNSRCAQTFPMRLNLFLPIILVCSSCMAQGPYVELKNERFGVELADTDEKRTLGLMFRDSMPDDQGMLFIFPGETRRSFWMKNTRIPLDIFYFDSNLALVASP